MAICARCGGEMTEGISCLTDPIVIEGKMYVPVRWGQEPRPRHRYEPEECRACGTPLGGVHHPGCGLERCPACHGQALSCPCLVESDIEATVDGECDFERAGTRRCQAHVLRRAGWL